jgi:hypothetical protein
MFEENYILGCNAVTSGRNWRTDEYTVSVFGVEEWAKNGPAKSRHLAAALLAACFWLIAWLTLQP